MSEKNKIDNGNNTKISTLKKLLPYLVNHKTFLIIGTLASLLGVVISFGIGFAITRVIDGIPSNPVEFNEYIDNAIFVALGVIILAAVTGFVARYFLENVAIRVTRDLRKRIFFNIINRDMAYIDNQSSGDLQARIVSDAGAVGGFLANQVPTIVTNTLKLFAGIVGALIISTKLTLIVIACVPFIFLPFLLLNKHLRKVGKMVQSSLANVGRFSGEIFRNIKVVRTFNKEKDEDEKFESLTGAVVQSCLSKLRLSLSISSIVGSLVLMGFTLLLWSAGKDINSGIMTVGQLTSYAYFAFQIVQAAGAFLGIFTSINIAVGTADKVLEYLDVETYTWPSVISNTKGNGEVEFKNVSFSYPSRKDVSVLRNVDFNVKAGSHTALVGGSGAGKSTLFELLLRLYPVQDGKIYIDGFDASELDIVKVRSSMGYVPQRESLISGNVADNILYGCADASEEDVIAAAKMAYADEFIKELPHGYQTNLGEVGNRLSGGQKQRLSLARAFIRNPKILLLDEAKNGLDTANEKLVAKAIEEWASKHNATVISITHSMETAKSADSIIVMEQGSVIAQGTHNDLLQTCAVYKKLSQQKEQVENKGEDESIQIDSLNSFTRDEPILEIT